jgi:hypothetical protein
MLILKVLQDPRRKKGPAMGKTIRTGLKEDDRRDADVPTGGVASASPADSGPCRPACPVCGGPLIEIRAKLQCRRCRTICETCCEGGRG